MQDSTALVLQRICDVFRLNGDIVRYEQLKAGHINRTYAATLRFEDGTEKKYILQSINMYVFKNPRAIMHNIDLVTSYIRAQKPSAALHFHHTARGYNYYVNSGEFWRVYTYVDGEGIDGDATEAGMYSAGKAFGEFQMLLADFDATQLKETIPDFHHTIKRFEHLYRTAEEDPCARLAFVGPELAFAHEAQEISCRVMRLVLDGKMPLRPTHNDTKTNNVLLDKKTMEPRCVIDLDTIMPGQIVHDFGDAIRFGANTAAEDERDLDKVQLDMDLFAAFTEGFVATTAPILSEVEVDSMALGAIAMTMECGVRFLDDYLSGDQYFKIDYPEHNLDRARCQFKLVREMIAHLDEMNDIVRDVYEKSIV